MRYRRRVRYKGRVTNIHYYTFLGTRKWWIVIKNFLIFSILFHSITFLSWAKILNVSWEKNWQIIKKYWQKNCCQLKKCLCFQGFPDFLMQIFNNIYHNIKYRQIICPIRTIFRPIIMLSRINLKKYLMKLILLLTQNIKKMWLSMSKIQNPNVCRGRVYIEL